MKTIPVFYTDAMVADGVTSPSAKKPKAVVAAWRRHLPIEIREPVAATIDDFALAHDRRHVDDVLSLRTANGFGTRSADVARSLPWTTGALCSAAREALANGRVACAPVSGFHHACFDHGGGYCTFNGLVVAALKARGLLPPDGPRRVGILDCDEHYGNGTDDILRRLNLDGISHWTLGGEGFGHRPSDAPRFLRTLPEVIAGMKAEGCGLLLYQAGADPHIDDPLGGFLTDDELRERDRIVFATCRELQLPVAWVLAGGYQEPIGKVIAIHVATMEECVRVHLPDVCR